MTYGCHNLPRPIAGAVTHVAQAGWFKTWYTSPSGMPFRSPIYVDIKHAMSTACRYDRSATDPGCAACEHAATRGEA